VIKKGKIKPVGVTVGTGEGIINPISTVTAEKMEFDKDDNYIRNGVSSPYTYYFIGSDTVLMNYKVDKDEDLVKWDNIKDKTATDAKAYIVGASGKKADFVVFFENFDNISKKDFYGIVSATPTYDGDDWYAEVNVYGKGKVEYKVDKDKFANIKKGHVVTFELTSSNKIKTITKADTETTAATVYKKSGNSLQFAAGQTFYRMTSDTVAYASKEDKKPDIDKKIDIEDIDENEEVSYIIDGAIIKAIRVNKYSTPSGGGGGAVTGAKVIGATTEVLVVEEDGVEKALDMSSNVAITGGSLGDLPGKIIDYQIGGTSNLVIYIKIKN